MPKDIIKNYIGGEDGGCGPVNKKADWISGDQSGYRRGDDHLNIGGVGI